MAEMTQFRQEVSEVETANVSAIGDISIALEAALTREREKAEQERNKLATEVVSLINTMLQGQHTRFSNAIDNVRQNLAASQTRIQDGYQIVSKGLDSWVERETVFSKKLLGNKDEVKKSIVDAAKVPRVLCCADNRRLTNVVHLFKRALDEFTPRRSSLLTVK